MTIVKKAAESGSWPLATSQTTAKEQLSAALDGLRQLIGAANIAPGSSESTDPLTAPFVLFVNPYIGKDTFAAGSYNTKEAAGGSTTEQIVAQKLKRLENQRLTCGYTRHAPFKTINRAVIEAAIITSKNWYINDPLAHVDCVCIVLAPGLHIFYNNPASEGTTVSAWSDGFEPTASQLIGFNPTEGGILLPRGGSILSEFGDLRHTIIRPSWVPNGNVDETPTYVDGVATYALRRQIVKTTGGGYAYGLTFMDKLGLNESHHLLSGFGHATRAELDAFYGKVFTACGSGGNLSQALLVARGTEYTIAAPISGTPTEAWDSTASASFYIFQTSVRSNYGMGRMWVDGSKVLGFKSFVCANFTGVSLQKSISEQGDMRCWQKYSGGNWVAVSNYADYINQTPDNVRMNPARRSVGIGVINEGFVQKVSIFDIGEGAQSFVDTGGEIDSNGGNSSFGGCAGLARGYRRAAQPNDRNWQISAIKVPLSVEAKLGNIQRYYLGTIASFTSSTITLNASLAAFGSSTTVPDLLGTNGYSLPSGSYLWVENQQGADWRAPLTSSAWSSSIPARLNISAALADPDGGAVGVGNNNISLALGARVYVRRLVDTRAPNERRLSIKLSNTTAARIPAASSVLQTDTTSSAIARTLSASSELLLVTATGVGDTPGSGVLKTAEITLRRGGTAINYSNATTYRAGTVVLYNNKHYINSKEITTISSVPDPTLWQETYVHMESTYAPEDNLKNEAPILLFDTDTDGAEDTTTCGIVWSTVWTSSAPVFNQYRTGTDYLGAFLLLKALGYSDSTAHAALVPRLEAARNRNPALSSSPTTTLALSSTAPTGGAANAAVNWPVEFRRPSTLWMGGHRWFGSGAGNYSKAVPAAAQDMSAQNRFTHYFTSQGGGRVIPQGAQEDGLLVSARGLEDTTTGTTLTVESIGAGDINTGQGTNLETLSVNNLTVNQSVTFNGLTNFNDGQAANTVGRLGPVKLASIAQLTATGSDALVAGNDSSLNANPEVVTLRGLNRWRQAQGLVSSGTETVTIFVTATAADRNLESMFSQPPSTIANAIPNLARAAEYANAVIGAGNQTAEIRIAPGLYDPASVWLCNVRFIAYNAALTTPLWDSSSVGTNTVPNNYFDGSGYADFANSVNFWWMRLGIRSVLVAGDQLGITIQPRTMRFSRGVDWSGGFHFLGLNEMIKAVGQSLIPISSFVADVAIASTLVPADFSSNLTNNVDALLSRIRVLNRPNANAFDSFAIGSLIRLSGSNIDSANIRDCVFGPGLPSHKESNGGARSPLIEVDGTPVISVRNIYIRGKTTITSAGIGISGSLATLPLASNAHYGSAAVSTPWTWEQTYHTFIGPRPDTSPSINLRFDGFFFVNTNPNVGNGLNYYVDLTGKLLPNHIHLLNSSGAVPSGTDTGPFFDQFIHAPAQLFIGFAWLGGGSSQSVVSANRLHGFVGRFGQNGYNTTKTRGVLGGNAGFLGAETGFTFTLTDSTVAVGTSRTIFQRAGITQAEADSAARPTFNASSTAPGEGFPTGLNPIITTDTSGSAALNVGLRSYLRGISVTNAITIPATNVIL